MTYKEENWKEKLSPEEYRILRQRGTEAPFTGRFNDHKESGVYVCKGCGTELFSSNQKFDSGSGWPSFFKPVNKKAVGETADESLGVERTEVHCKKCGGHLGHVFPDAPKQNEKGDDTGGLRYCINSTSLDFKRNTMP